MRNEYCRECGESFDISEMVELGTYDDPYYLCIYCDKKLFGKDSEYLYDLHKGN